MTVDERREPSDASRRTHLAAERTYLAWIRSGLSALAVSLAVGRLLPALLDVSRGPFLLLGAGYALLGLFLLGYGLVRHRSVEHALAQGSSVAIPGRVVIGLTVLGLALALGTIVILFA